MSDMSRPLPLPTAPDHELHDPLLVAQHASGDALGADEHRMAQSWVSTCGACAALASDLRAVSGAVAWEPTPARRRDFRISDDQAERLRGNAFSRFMRRLALPDTRTLRPAAAGAMSLGLLFIVAGAVWPGDELALESVEPASVPAPLVEQWPSATGAPLEVTTPDAAFDADLADASEVNEEPPLDESLMFAAEAPILGSADEEGASKAAVDDTAADRMGQELERAARPESFDGLEETTDTSDVREAAVETGLEYQSNAAAEVGAGVVPPAGEASAIEPDEAHGFVEERGPSGGAGEDRAATTVAVAADDGPDPETLLVLAGLVLALGGGILLALTWLSSRARDPLLR